MTRLARGSSSRARRQGYTLIEILVATGLSLVLMYAVVTVFASVGESVNNSRATLEMTDRLRTAAAVLRQDLDGITVTPIPPVSPDSGQGYLQITEGPIGSITRPEDAVVNLENPNPSGSGFLGDSTVGDLDDILMFTTRSKTRPFVGRLGSGTIESPVAEVIYFVRGRTLYRRVRLVVPAAQSRMLAAANRAAPNNLLTRADFVHSGGNVSPYAIFDVSFRIDRAADGTFHLVANTLGDLTRPETRYAHAQNSTVVFPGHPHQVTSWRDFGLPTLRETSSTGFLTAWWPASSTASLALPDLTDTALVPHTPERKKDTSGNVTVDGTFDAWTNPHPWNNVNAETGDISDFAGSRVGEDVVLTNVLGFDVRVWDPGAPVLLISGVTLLPGDPAYRTYLSNLVTSTAPTPDVISFGAYVDLNYMNSLLSHSSNPDYLEYIAGTTTIDEPRPQFAGFPSAKSNLNFTTGEAVYDTWSTHFESDGIDQHGDSMMDLGTNGYDDDSANGTDDPGERETSPPYAAALRGLQVKIRTFDPDSRQIREVTIGQDFMPK